MADLQKFTREKCGFELELVPTPHCFDSHAIILKLYEDVASKQHFKKIMYTGDTRPDRTIIERGQGADVLIHECTYEPNRESLAKSRMHSTFNEALRVAMLMEAKNLVLTHFSQTNT